MPSHRDLLFVLSVAILLSACQTLPREAPPVAAEDIERAWDERRAELAGLERWYLQGRIAVASQGRGWNGSLHWRQDGEEIVLQLDAPLGAGSLRIEGTPRFMHIRSSDGTDLLSTDPDHDLVHWLGAPLPVGSLRWWALGMPDPGTQVPVELDAGGRPLAFEQAGWQVSYPRYTEHGGVVLPGLVVAERDDARLRMIVDRWSRPDDDD